MLAYLKIMSSAEIINKRWVLSGSNRTKGAPRVGVSLVTFKGASEMSKNIFYSFPSECGKKTCLHKLWVVDNLLRQRLTNYQATLSSPTVTVSQTVTLGGAPATEKHSARESFSVGCSVRLN